MATTRGNLRSLCKNNLQQRADIDDEIDDALDHACVALSELHWTELRSRDDNGTTATDAQTVALPSDCEEPLRVQLLNDASSYEVPIWSKEQAEGRYPAADQFSTAAPEVCYREGSNLYFCPSPNEALSVRVHYRATLTLAAGASGALSHEGLNHLIVAAATAEVFEGLEHGTVSAARWWKYYNAAVERKQRSQEAMGAQKRMDLRLGDVGGPHDPRIKDPTVMYWTGGR